MCVCACAVTCTSVAGCFPAACQGTEPRSGKWLQTDRTGCVRAPPHASAGIERCRHMGKHTKLGQALSQLPASFCCPPASFRWPLDGGGLRNAAGDAGGEGLQPWVMQHTLARGLQLCTIPFAPWAVGSQILVPSMGSRFPKR